MQDTRFSRWCVYIWWNCELWQRFIWYVVTKVTEERAMSPPPKHQGRRPRWSASWRLFRTSCLRSA